MVVRKVQSSAVPVETIETIAHMIAHGDSARASLVHPELDVALDADIKSIVFIGVGGIVALALLVGILSIIWGKPETSLPVLPVRDGVTAARQREKRPMTLNERVGVIILLAFPLLLLSYGIYRVYVSEQRDVPQRLVDAVPRSVIP
ncbi:MAG: hypothetical protein ACREX3_00350 [Gammaproteobacteria bacterium]